MAQVAGLTALATEPQPDADRGLYGVWAKPEQMKLSLLRGGQVHLQWRDVQSRPGQYDFSPLDEAVAQAAAAKRPVTVQINGNRHPRFLFEQVPHCAKKLSVQVSDAEGTLQYWHPVYRKAYLDLVAAYGQHLRSSPHRQAVLGVRLNFNAVGTEHFDVPADAQDPAQWICPPGVEPGPRWTRELIEPYQKDVVRAFIENFRPEIRVFVRNNAVARFRNEPEVLQRFETGQLGLFHTSSEMEPRGKGGESQYGSFIEFCRSGKTLAYAEPWADAWGRHGGKTDERWCSPCQFNYWRLLVDLHCGVSFIALYGADLAHAQEPEFRAAFEFAAKYAGYHASPSVSPGAWAALREGNSLQGDYTFFMSRLPGDESKPVSKVGPDDQRFGAWARVIPQGGRARFKIDERFVESCRGQTPELRVVYLDDAKGVFVLKLGGKALPVEMKGSGRWQTAKLSIEDAQLSDGNSEAQVQILPKTDLTLHMVEVSRAVDSGAP